MKIVFYLGISSLILYRVVATYKIWELSQIIEGFKASKWRLFRQLIDVELWSILLLSHRIGLNGSSSPQRMLKVLEATLESAPQVQMHSVFLFAVCDRNTTL